MDHIEEFQSPNFHGVAQKCFLILLVIVAGVLVTRGREVAHQRRAAGSVRDLCGTLRVAEYSDFFDPAGDDRGALAARVAESLESFSLRMSAVELGLRGHLVADSRDCWSRC